MNDTRDTRTVDDAVDPGRPSAEAGESAQRDVQAQPGRSDPGATPGPARLSTADISESGRQGATHPSSGGSTEAVAAAQPQQADDQRTYPPLFDEGAAAKLRDRWLDVQTGFVDEPRSAVEQADTLVAEVMKRLAEGFATERRALEGQWSRGDDVSTEDLRIALRRYRSFFDRLLSV